MFAVERVQFHTVFRLQSIDQINRKINQGNRSINQSINQSIDRMSGRPIEQQLHEEKKSHSQFDIRGNNRPRRFFRHTNEREMIHRIPGTWWNISRRFQRSVIEKSDRHKTPNNNT